MGLQLKNPVIKGQFADPDVIYYQGMYYLYPTTDGFDGWSGTKFHCFSSKDLQNWTDEGLIVDVKADSNEEAGINCNGVQIAFVPWAVGNAWAPTIAEHNGKFYHYFCAKRKPTAADLENGATNAGPSCIGVAVSDGPVGPFKAMEQPLITPDICKANNVKVFQTIDPGFYEEDGTPFLLFGNGDPECACIVQLGQDYTSLVPESMKNLQGTVDFRESIQVLKKDGIYHFTWTCDDTGSANYHVNYGTSTSLYGPITYHYPILQKNESDHILGTGHHCIFQGEDSTRFFIAYHRFLTPLGQVTSGFGFHRETCIDELFFDENGQMKEIHPVQY